MTPEHVLGTDLKDTKGIECIQGLTRAKHNGWHLMGLGRLECSQALLAENEGEWRSIVGVFLHV